MAETAIWTKRLRMKTPIPRYCSTEFGACVPRCVCVRSLFGFQHLDQFDLVCAIPVLVCHFSAIFSDWLLRSHRPPAKPASKRTITTNKNRTTVACLELVHHWRFGGLYQGSEDLCPERFQSKRRSNWISGCWLCSSVLFYGWLVSAVAKVEYFLINVCVRISVFQGISLTLVEVLVIILRILVIPLHDVLEACRRHLDFFFRFSFAHVLVEVDLLKFLVELGEIVGAEVVHFDPALDDAFPGGFRSKFTMTWLKKSCACSWILVMYCSRSSLSRFFFMIEYLVCVSCPSESYAA